MVTYFIPGILLLLVVYSTYKKNNTYTSFVKGAKESFDLVLTCFPYLVAILVAIAVYNASTLNIIVTNFLSPFLNFFGIPKELTELIVLKNFSGGGSLAIIENIYSTYNVDSYIARAGSVIMGSSEAVFYISAVFFSKTKVEKFSYAIPIALLITFISSVFACWICRFI